MRLFNLLNLKMVRIFVEHFFGHYETAALVADMTDDEIWALRRGAHDSEKLYAAYVAQKNATKPVVILAHQVKGYKIPEAESKTPLTNLKNVLRKP